MILELQANKPYDFDNSARDHGWIALAPFRWLDESNSIQRVERLSSGKVVLLRLSAVEDEPVVLVKIEVQPRISAIQQQELKDRVRWMLRLDEDFSEFYALAADHPPLAKKVTGGRGRLLRSSTLWEDVVKTICTTNTTWSQTKQMVSRIVDALGDPYPLDSDLRAFPTAEQAAEAGEALFESNVRLGYRNGYVLQLAREIAQGKRDLEALKSANLPTKELKRELKSIKGVGDYAAHTLLMILGHYDEVAVDTELRNHVNKTYANGKPMTDREMAAIYDRWGRWKYLAYWFDNY